MKTILSVIKEFMSSPKNIDKEFSFDEIFKEVESNLSHEWAKNENMDFDEIINRKKGEIYKLLTIDGGFIRTEEGNFKLRRN